MSSHLIFKVSAIRDDSPNLKTYVFKYNLRARAGQFVMLWMPGVDELPMSIAWQTEEEFYIGVADAGDGTHAIHEKIKIGDKLGIRGPFGTSFNFKNYDKIIAVAGGYGVPPILNLAQKVSSLNKDCLVIQGARNKDFLLYEDLFSKLNLKLKIATDDGSKGYKGYTTELLEEELKNLDKSKKTCIYTCGPEAMMVKVAQLAKKYNVDSQVSLERFMKCGFGVCGQCCMDDSGIRLCKEGPVITGSYALEHPEFGNYSRKQSGAIE